MKKLNVLAISAAVAGVIVSSAAVAADVSANLGLATQYYFRGVQQTTGAAAQGGVDYEHESGAYAGIWASDVGGHDGSSAGIETDYYFGYGGEVEDFSYGLGYTLYTYTGDFDTEYSEINLSGGYGPLSLEFSTGTHEEGATDADYTFTAVTYEYESLSATYGVWGSDFEGAYLEIGFSKEISELDFGISIINGDAEDSPSAGSTNVATDGTALVLTIGKSFDL